MKVEKIREPGQCIDIDSALSTATLKNCDGAASWRYYYDGNAARLEHADLNPHQCLGRRAGESNDDYVIIEDESLAPNAALADLEIFPTGLVPCSQDKVVYWRNTIAGEEHNVFQWSLIDVKTGFALGPSYCVDVPQIPQSECPKPLTENITSWRKYGDSGDATEISVKPSAALQDITDPEVLFQFYLFTMEGKASRILDPIDAVNVRLADGESAFSAFKTILIPLQQLPKVGPAFKVVSIPVKFVAKALKVRFQCFSMSLS